MYLRFIGVVLILSNVGMTVTPCLNTAYVLDKRDGGLHNITSIR
jgi:hypothetical protein